jgi:glycosyltransferase involved in cell wall biosynthesis
MRLVNDAELRATLGASARKTIHEQYSLERMIVQVEQVYHRLLAVGLAGTLTP